MKKGTSRNDILVGGPKNDQLFGKKGHDILLGNAGNDLLHGGKGHDTLLGGKGHDWLFGGNGCDTLIGGKGNDWLFGGNGNDTLLGGAGKDYVDGGTGNDRLIYNLSENIGACDFYAGGKGYDTLVLQLTYSEYVLASVQQDIQNFNDFLACGRGWFEFSSFDLRASGFERLEIVLLDNAPTVPAPAAPVAVDDSFGVNEDALLMGSVLDNDTDLDSPTLTSALVSGTANGVLVFNTDGTFTYTPNANFHGSDSFTYRASDGSLDSNIATVAINVAPVNDAPVAQDDSFGVDEDGVLVASVLDNDTDIDSLTLTPTLVSGTANGVLALNADGTFTYTPDANFNGSDSFTYLANDGNLDSNIVTVAINVAAVNDAPVAVNDSFDVEEDNTLVVAAPAVLGNDTDVDSLTLTSTLVTSTANGVLIFETDGSFTYAPNANFSGTDSFTYLAHDGSLDSNVATVTINVAAVNDAPVAVDDTNTTNEDTFVEGELLANDPNVDIGDTLTVTKVNGGNVGTQISLASGALLTVNADGSYTYDPNGMFESLGVGQTATDSFTYEAKDSHDEPSNMATATVTILGMNDAPVATSDSHTTSTKSPVDGNVLANDTDVDTGDTLVVSAVNGDSNNVGNQFALTSGALLTLNADGTYTYNPNGAFDSLGAGQTATDSFTYEVQDPQEASSTATVSITITPPLRVGVIGVNASAVADTVAQLDDSTAFAMDAEAIELSAEVDWSTELASYDVIVVGGSGDAFTEAQQFANSQLFPALQDFVNDGGGVVTTGWFVYTLNYMYFLYGANDPAPLAADYVSPISDPNPFSSLDFTYSIRENHPTITVLDSGHAITEGATYELDGVAVYDVDAAYHEQAMVMDPTATRLAWGLNFSGTQDAVAIAYDEVGDGLTVYLGGLYLADPGVYDADDLRSGSSDQLLEQAVAWAAGGGEDTGGMQLTDFAADAIL